MSVVTKPTVGRKVWFFASAQHALENAAGVAEAQPFDATVIFVHDDRMVNLRVTNPYGESGPVLGVSLRQDGDPPINGPHAQWMPYQVKQAERAAAVEPEYGGPIESATKHVVTEVKTTPPRFELDENTQIEKEKAIGIGAYPSASGVDSPGEPL